MTSDSTGILAVALAALVGPSRLRRPTDATLRAVRAGAAGSINGLATTPVPRRVVVAAVVLVMATVEAAR